MTALPQDRKSGSGPLHGLLIIALIAIAAFIPACRDWPWLWLEPLAAYGATVALFRPLRISFRPWRFGHASKPSILATVIVTVVSCVVLVTFHRVTRPDVRDFLAFLPIAALGGLISAGVGFSILNALLEEIVFRGILFDAVESQWGAWPAAAATAFLFGYGHMHGYPPGPLGAVLAGTYGFCLGGLRAHTGGLGLCVLSHIAADATIYILITGPVR